MSGGSATSVSTVDYQLLKDVRDRVIAVSEGTGQPIRNVFGNEYAHSYMMFGSRLNDIVPFELQNRWNSISYSFNAIPQALGEYEKGKETTLSMNRLVSTRHVTSLVDVIRMLYEIDQANAFLEGRSSSDNLETFTGMANNILWSRRMESDFNARAYLRGKGEGGADGENEKVRIIACFGEQLETIAKNNTWATSSMKKYGWEELTLMNAGGEKDCALKAILLGIEMKFNTSVEYNEEMIQQAKNYCVERDGLNCEEILVLIENLSIGGIWDIDNLSLKSLFKILVIEDMQVVDPFPHLSHERGMKRQYNSGYSSKNYYLILYQKHWYLFGCNRSHALQRMIYLYSSKSLPKPKPSPLSLQHMDFLRPMEDDVGFVEMHEGLRMMEDLLNECMIKISHKKNIILYGMAGTGKSWLMQEMRKKLYPNEFSSFTALVARGGEFEGRTLHSCFNGFTGHPKANLDEDIRYFFIDEMSQVKLRWWYFMDQAFQNLKGNKLLFGGVQIITSGDYMQMPPIVGDSDGNKWKKRDAEAAKFGFVSDFVVQTIRQEGLIQCKVPMRFIGIRTEEQERFYNHITLARQGICTDEFATDIRDRICQWSDEILLERNLPQIIAKSNPNCVKIHNIYCRLKSTMDNPAMMLKSLKMENGIGKAEHDSYRSLSDTFLLLKGVELIISSNDMLAFIQPQSSRFMDMLLGCDMLQQQLDNDKVKLDKIKVNNGDRIKWLGHTNKYFLVERNGKKILLRPFKETLHKRWALKPSLCITIYGSQGATFESVCLYTPNIYPDGFYQHEAFTALSRTKEWKGFRWLTDNMPSRRELDRINIKRMFKANAFCLKFTQQPNKLYVPAVFPHVDHGVVGDDTILPYFYNMEISSGNPLRYQIQDRRRDNHGFLYDVMKFMETKMTVNTIWFDIETKTVQDDQIEDYLTCFDYMLEGVIQSPDRWFPNGMPARDEPDDSDYKRSCYIWSDENELSMDKFTRLCMNLARKIFTKATEFDPDEDKDQAKIRRAYHRQLLPLRIAGTNIHNFDLLQFFKALNGQVDLASEKAEIIKVSASQCKGLSISRRHSWTPGEYINGEYVETGEEQFYWIRIIESFDLQDVLGIVKGGLGTYAESYVAPHFQKSIEEFRQVFLNQVEQVARYTNEEKEELCKRWKAQDIEDYNANRRNKDNGKKRKVTVDMLEEYYEPRKNNIIAMYKNGVWNPRHRNYVTNVDALYHQQELSKGCMPLKYMDRITHRDYYSIGCVNIRKEIEDYGWESVFYDRELRKAKTYWQNRMEELEDFPIMYKIKEYCHSDNFITRMVARALNNQIYHSFVNEIRNGSQVDGMRVSLFEFSTVCDLTTYNMMELYPETCMDPYQPKGKIRTLDAILDKKTYELIRMTPGGKTLPRAYHWISKDGGEKDYYVQLDCRGMYHSIMQNRPFPIGGMRDVSQEEMDEICVRVNSGAYSPYHDGFYICTAVTSNHPKCLDPPVGRKVPHYYWDSEPIKWESEKTLLKYFNPPFPSRESNVTLFDIVQAGGRVHHITKMIKWMDSGKQLEPYMEKLAAIKVQAEQDENITLKNYTKLQANGAFGSLLKKTETTLPLIELSLEDPVLQHLAEQINYDESEMDVKFEVTSNKSIIFTLTNREFAFSTRPNQLGAFVLDGSKSLNNQIIRVMNGPDALVPGLAEEVMMMYSDTDSAVISAKALQRLVVNDQERLGEGLKTLLYYKETIPEEETQGQYADELCEKHLGAQIDYASGLCGRIIEIHNPQPKCKLYVYLQPPKEYLGQPSSAENFPPLELWQEKYCYKAKGAPYQCEMIPDMEHLYQNPEKLEIWNQWTENMEQEKAGENRWTHMCMKLSNEYGVPLHTKKDTIKRYLDMNGENNFSMHKKPLPRTLFDGPWGGRIKVDRVHAVTGQVFESVVPPGFLEQEEYPEKCCPEYGQDHICQHECCNLARGGIRHYCVEFALKRAKEMAAYFT